MKKNYTKIVFAGLLSALSSTGASADEIVWTRVDTSAGTTTSFGNEVTPIYTSATSGSFDSDGTGTSATFGFVTNGTDGPGSSIQQPTIYSVDGGHMTTQYTFDQTLEGGSLLLSGGWQHGDYEVSIFGGGTLETSEIRYIDSVLPNGELGTDFVITGEGSSTLNFDAITVGTNPGNIGYFFEGILNITGEWTGISISQTHNPDNLNSSNTNRKDIAASLGLSNVTIVPEIVPEPSSAMLLLVGAAGVLTRRKR